MTAGIGNFLGKAITKVTTPDAKLPIILLEGTVVAGRTKKAFDRGGVPEARERVIEESSGSIVWLGGVTLFNYIGDKIIGKILNTPKDGRNKRIRPDVDLGHDALRKPFNNFLNNRVLNPKNFSERAISMMKFGKVATSILAANYIMGFGIPPFNHKLTNYFERKDKNHIVPQIHFGEVPQKTRFDYFRENVIKKDTEAVQPLRTLPFAFKGGLNTFTNFIESTNAGQLLSTDLGVLGGRTYNARKKEERNEIIIRDGGSIYFYMWAQDHVRAGLNKIETGRWTRLDPNTANVLNEELMGMFNKKESMSAKEFRKAVFGDGVQIIDLDKFFGADKEVITLEEFNAVETDPKIRRRAAEMSKLQPKQLDTSVLSKEQIVDIYTKGRVRAPKFLKKAYETFTGGDSSNPNKYVSAKKLEKLKGRMFDYVEDIIKAAEKGDGVVNKSLLSKMRHKNLMYSGINFLVGFTTASAFLSKFIPDIQYWYTRKTTGQNSFPGVTDYNTDKKQAMRA